MGLRKYSLLIYVAVAALVGYGLHKISCMLFLSKTGTEICAHLEFLYGIFCLFSISIVLILIQVKSKAIDSTGYAFLLLTCIKMAFAYAVFSRILNGAETQTEYDKLHLFAIFAYFLIIETVVTAKLLNPKT